MQEQRIKLAEAMGWSARELPPVGIDKVVMWEIMRPNGKSFKWPTKHYSFDPWTNATDCESVIRKLNDLSYWLEIYRNPIGCVIRMGKHDMVATTWRGDDYKQGVCELALKVLND